ncbi:MAG: hypothetical protein EXR72_14690 [Myxococcales bacterium]|nr:hypothetical protein [Myxococcales bacterium]
MERQAKLERVPSSCGGCGDAESARSPHRRGRCRRCYDAWVRARPVGLGAFCNGCGDRRREHLRHFELYRTWVVLCHTCAARAEAIAPLPLTVNGLRVRLLRDRRWGDRRAESVGAQRTVRGSGERRDGDRREGDREILDATEFAEMVLELEAEFADPAEDQDPADGPITGVHRLADLGQA